MITFKGSELTFKAGNSTNGHITILVFAQGESKLASVKTRAKLLGWLHAADNYDDTVTEISSLNSISFSEVTEGDDVVELDIVDAN